MGPAGKNLQSQAMQTSSDSKRNREDAPALVPGQDRQKWRRDVMSWMDIVETRAKVKDKKSIATEATFAYVLYDAVDSCYQKVLDHARDSGTLSFDGEKQRQKAVVMKIIELIGQDTPLEIIDRLLSVYKQVHTCIRLQNEQPSQFATRFRGLASKYMSLAGVSATEQESQLLAMVMLQNARLPSDTQNAVKIQLVAQGQQRTSSSQSPLPVSKDFMNNLSNMMATLSTAYQSADTGNVAGPSGNDTEMRIFSVSAYDHILQMIKNAAQITSAELSRTRIATASRDTKHKIYLDDVYNILKSLDTSGKLFKQRSSIEHKDKGLFVAEEHTLLPKSAALFAATASRKRPTRLHNKSRKFSERKKNTTCHSCKQTGHWRGDPECPNKRPKIDTFNGQPNATTRDGSQANEADKDFRN